MKGKKTHPDLFTWAESTAARLGRSRDDVATAAMTGIPTMFTGLLGIWSRAPAQSALPLALAVAVPLTAMLCIGVFAVRACRERIRPGVSILLQGGSLVVTALCLSVCVGFLLKVEFDARSARNEQLAKEREAEVKQRAELEELAKSSKDAVAKETECLKKWVANAKATHKRQQNAKGKLEECRTAYSQQFLPFSSFEATCRASITEIELADRAHASAMKRVCSTASIK